MKRVILTGAFVAVVALAVSPCASGQDSTHETSPEPVEHVVSHIHPNYVPPSAVVSYLGAEMTGARGVLSWTHGDRRHTVEIRANEAANLLTVSGPAPDVAYVEALARGADVAPRQIEIEVVLVEISTGKARDLGIDWQDMLDRSQISWDYRQEDTERFDMAESQPGEWWTKRTDTDELSRQTWSMRYSTRIGDVLHLIDESGAGKIRNAPRILTLNNHPATLLDGERVTYVTRYSSYTNLYETETMDAGLTIHVLPSLGASGYITLDITAELTTLVKTISGSPVKDGQMLENSVIVKDGESVLLGGLTRTLEDKRVKRFPILGHVLPFLFSRTITKYEELESFIVLTPRVVDLETGLDDDTREKALGG